MTLNPDDPDLPLTRIERQRLRDIAERVRLRQERLAEQAARCAHVADIRHEGPDGIRRRPYPRQYRETAPTTWWK